MALLKGGCIELMVLRSVINYDTEKHAWQVSHHFIHGEISPGGGIQASALAILPQVKKYISILPCLLTWYADLSGCSFL